MASTVSAVNDYKHIDVKPLSGVLGAEISGLDLREHLPAEVVAEVRAAFLEQLVIFFRDQSLDPQQFVRFAARFGAIDAHHGSDIADFIASLRRIRASNVKWLLPSHGPIFRKDDDLLDRTIARLESYRHMADFGTCATDWPLMDEWERELREGKMPNTN